MQLETDKTVVDRKAVDIVEGTHNFDTVLFVLAVQVAEQPVEDLSAEQVVKMPAVEPIAALAEPLELPAALKFQQAARKKLFLMKQFIPTS